MLMSYPKCDMCVGVLSIHCNLVLVNSVSGLLRYSSTIASCANIALVCGPQYLYYSI